MQAHEQRHPTGHIGDADLREPILADADRHRE
jgi:hypothetical protein